MESARFRKRNSDARKEGRSKGVYSFCQIQRKKPNDHNTIKALPVEQKSWEGGSDFAVEAYRNLWTEEAIPQRSVDRKRKDHG